MIPQAAAMRALIALLAALALLGLGAWLGWDAANTSWTARWESREREWTEKVLAEEKKARAIEAQAAKTVAQVRDDHAAAVHVLRADLDRALGELRREQTRARLKPAATAPAACRDYEAPPSQLSVPDAEILVRLAGRADEDVARLELCRRYVAAVLYAFGMRTTADDGSAAAPSASPTGNSPARNDR